MQHTVARTVVADSQTEDNTVTVFICCLEFLRFVSLGTHKGQARFFHVILSVSVTSF